MYQVTCLGLHVASMTKMAIRKKLLPREEFNGPLVSKGKVIKGPFIRQNCRGHLECLIASVLRIFLTAKYVAPAVDIFNRDPLICFLN